MGWEGVSERSIDDEIESVAKSTSTESKSVVKKEELFTESFSTIVKCYEEHGNVIDSALIVLVVLCFTKKIKEFVNQSVFTLKRGASLAEVGKISLFCSLFVLLFVFVFVAIFGARYSYSRQECVSYGIVWSLFSSFVLISLYVFKKFPQSRIFFKCFLFVSTFLFVGQSRGGFDSLTASIFLLSVGYLLFFYKNNK